MDLFEAQRMAKDELQKHGLTAQGWRFGFDRARTRHGLCNHRRKTIQLSHYTASVNTVEEVRDTILHEIAHALCGPGEGHGYLWRQTCIRIGAKPSRCNDKHANDVADKYIAKCSLCDKFFFRNRLPKHGRYSFCPGHGINSAAVARLTWFYNTKKLTRNMVEKSSKAAA